jgi:transcriptional regulator with XRE-family HTH domain
VNGLGNYVRERRVDLGLTQEELAARIGDTATQAEISRLERGTIAFPRRRRLEALAAALEVTLGMLLVKSGWLTSSEEALIDAGPALPPSPQLEPPTADAILAEMDQLREALHSAIERIGEVEGRIRTMASQADQQAVPASNGHLEARPRCAGGAGAPG